MQYQHVTRGKAYGQKANKASSLAALLARDKQFYTGWILSNDDWHYFISSGKIVAFL